MSVEYGFVKWHLVSEVKVLTVFVHKLAFVYNFIAARIVGNLVDNPAFLNNVEIEIS